MNRGSPEVYPNDIDVKTLTLRLIKNYFDYAEANHNGVAVEEVPADVRACGACKCDPYYRNQTFEDIGKYNLRMSGGSGVLAGCFSVALLGWPRRRHAFTQPPVTGSVVSALTFKI